VEGLDVLPHFAERVYIRQPGVFRGIFLAPKQAEKIIEGLQVISSFAPMLSFDLLAAV
jgi:hypothetical protein